MTRATNAPTDDVVVNPRVRAWQTVRQVVRRMGFDLVRYDHYSPVPDVDAIDPTLWDGPTEMPGVTFDVEAQLGLLEGELAPALAEARRELAPGGTLAPRLENNQTFGAADIAVLYAWLRHLKPKRVLEFGSGVSTLVTRTALARNREEGVESEHRIFDPYLWHGTLDDEGVTVIRTSATDVDPSEFEALEAGDVLFIDTTHTVRTGGEVNSLLLGGMPRVAPGVVVHIHDICTPWEYPRFWIHEYGYYWAEQYVLQAFLAFNDRFEVLVGNYACAKASVPRMSAATAPFEPRGEPSSIWLRHVESGSAT